MGLDHVDEYLLAFVYVDAMQVDLVGASVCDVQTRDRGVFSERGVEVGATREHRDKRVCLSSAVSWSVRCQQLCPMHVLSGVLGGKRVREWKSWKSEASMDGQSDIDEHGPRRS